MSKKEIDVFELYAEDPEKADRVVFGRVVNPNRRGFLKGAGLATMAAMVGGFIPFHRNMPAGFIPAALAEEPFRISGKDGLTVLNDRPVNAECPPHLLDDQVTPTSRHFVRNNGVPPANVDAAGWKLTVDGEVKSPMTMTIEDLKKKFDVVTLQLQLECGGNGRSFFDPKAKGNQWTVGAVGCSEWTGVRLADVLKAAGLKDSAVYTAHYGADTHLSGDPKKLPISRGVPISKAMDKDNLIAFAQNGAPIHPMNGAPLRLVIPGWPGSCSHKWLTRIWIRDQVHDGPKMTGKSYRVPEYPVEPGEKVPKEAFRIIEAMPVKSLITYPKSGLQLQAAKPMLQVRGHAWAGDSSIRAVDISIDFGATWTKANLRRPRNSHAWQHFSADITFPMKGYYEVWARATDEQRRMQPFAIAWNPKGYLNNSMHRVAVRVV
ncbi:MAG: molybdopterin-dependent oxidoreductase [Gammaproteobacteria bacterium]|nr:molybdopterin-dependent oxidoreductase [Gammaproteobacteria bacterium]